MGHAISDRAALDCPLCLTIFHTSSTKNFVETVAFLWKLLVERLDVIVKSLSYLEMVGAVELVEVKAGLEEEMADFAAVHWAWVEVEAETAVERMEPMAKLPAVWSTN